MVLRALLRWVALSRRHFKKTSTIRDLNRQEGNGGGGGGGGGGEWEMSTKHDCERDDANLEIKKERGFFSPQKCWYPPP